MPPPRRGSEPKVGLRSVPRFAAAIRFARAFSSSPDAALGALGDEGGVAADSPRARRFDSIKDAMSSAGGRGAEGAGVGAAFGGGTGTAGTGLFSATTGG